VLPKITCSGQRRRENPSVPGRLRESTHVDFTPLSDQFEMIRMEWVDERVLRHR
jgi:hypothetical protein